MKKTAKCLFIFLFVFALCVVLLAACGGNNSITNENGVHYETPSDKEKTDNLSEKDKEPSISDNEHRYADGFKPIADGERCARFCEIHQAWEDEGSHNYTNVLLNADGNVNGSEQLNALMNLVSIRCSRCGHELSFPTIDDYISSVYELSFWQDVGAFLRNVLDVDYSPYTQVDCYVLNDSSQVNHTTYYTTEDGILVDENGVLAGKNERFAYQYQNRLRFAEDTENARIATILSDGKPAYYVFNKQIATREEDGALMCLQAVFDAEYKLLGRTMVYIKMTDGKPQVYYGNDIAYKLENDFHNSNYRLNINYYCEYGVADATKLATVRNAVAEKQFKTPNAAELVYNELTRVADKGTAIVTSRNNDGEGDLLGKLTYNGELIYCETDSTNYGVRVNALLMPDGTFKYISFEDYNDIKSVMDEDEEAFAEIVAARTARGDYSDLFEKIPLTARLVDILNMDLYFAYDEAGFRKGYYAFDDEALYLLEIFENTDAYGLFRITIFPNTYSRNGFDIRFETEEGMQSLQYKNLFDEWHEHFYADEWTTDETHHWHVSTCKDHIPCLQDQDHDYIESYGEHDWTQWTVKTVAKHGVAGVEERECSVCHAKEERSYEHECDIQWTYSDQIIVNASGQITVMKSGHCPVFDEDITETAVLGAFDSDAATYLASISAAPVYEAFVYTSVNYSLMISSAYRYVIGQTDEDTFRSKLAEFSINAEMLQSKEDAGYTITIKALKESADDAVVCFALVFAKEDAETQTLYVNPNGMLSYRATDTSVLSVYYFEESATIPKELIENTLLA